LKPTDNTYYYLNDYHQQHCEVAANEVHCMLQHPLTFADAQQQVRCIEEASMMSTVNGNLPDLADAKAESAPQRPLKPSQHQPVITDKINEAIQQGKWSDDAIQELNDVVIGLEGQAYWLLRFPASARQGFTLGGRIHEAASAILQGKGGEDCLSDSNNLMEQSINRNFAQRPVQENIIETWAKQAGNAWFDSVQQAIDGLPWLAQGGEAIVYYNEETGLVRKLLSLDYFVTPQFALDRITLHNMLFPESALNVKGFTRDDDGTFYIVAEQPFIIGEHVGLSEIRQYMSHLGFAQQRNIYTNGCLYVTDLHDQNVIKTDCGTLIVIDADIRLNTPEVNKNGRYKIIDQIVKNNQP